MGCADRLRSGEAGQGFGVRGLGDAALREDSANVAVGRQVERRGGGGNIGRDPYTLNVGDLGGTALLDGNMLAIGYREIKGGNRRGNVEGDVVFLGQDGNLIGADFIGGVAIRGDAVRTSDNGADFAGFQEVADHVVRDQGEGNAAAVKFPGSEPRALQIGAGLRNQNVQFVTLLESDADDPQRGANSSGGQGARVALRHDLAFLGHEFRAETADGFVGGLFFEVHFLSFGDEGSANFGEAGGGGEQFREASFHALQSPEEVDGRGARFREGAGDFVEFHF